MNSQQVNGKRDQLLTMFSIALSAVDGHQCTYEFLTRNSIATMDVRVVSVGKAASAMMQGAMSALGERLRSGLVITKQGDSLNGQGDTDNRIILLESDHPVPTARSIAAGEHLLEFVSQVKGDELLLMLISGGTSSLVEVLNENITLEQLALLNKWCLANPVSIAQINVLRKSISKIKAGRLLNYIHTENIVQLTVSDVKDNNLSVIGSGLLVASHNTDSQRLIDSMSLPEWLVSLLQRQQEILDSAPTTAQKVKHHIIADNQLAREAVVNHARQQGLEVKLNQDIYLEFSLAVEAITRTLIDGESGLYIWGGECVLALPDEPGQGGRCQSLALAIADYIKDMNIVLLVAGTDGNDGPGEAAGAFVDGSTISQGEALGLNAAVELKKANAGYYLSELGNLIDTGPTNTNVTDLIIALKYSD